MHYWTTHHQKNCKFLKRFVQLERSNEQTPHQSNIKMTTRSTENTWDYDQNKPINLNSHWAFKFVLLIILSGRFNQHVVELRYDISSAFRCNSTWESFQMADLRTWLSKSTTTIILRRTILVKETSHFKSLQRSKPSWGLHSPQGKRRGQPLLTTKPLASTSRRYPLSRLLRGAVDHLECISTSPPPSAGGSDLWQL